MKGLKKKLEIRKRLLAGILCAGLLFQSAPASVYAAEAQGTAGTDETLETETLEAESPGNPETATGPAVADPIQSLASETTEATGESTPAETGISVPASETETSGTAQGTEPTETETVTATTEEGTAEKETETVAATTEEGTAEKETETVTVQTEETTAEEAAETEETAETEESAETPETEGTEEEEAPEEIEMERAADFSKLAFDPTKRDKDEYAEEGQETDFSTEPEMTTEVTELLMNIEAENSYDNMGSELHLRISAKSGKDISGIKWNVNDETAATEETATETPQTVEIKETANTVVRVKKTVFDKRPKEENGTEATDENGNPVMEEYSTEVVTEVDGLIETKATVRKEVSKKSKTYYEYRIKEKGGKMLLDVLRDTENDQYVYTRTEDDGNVLLKLIKKGTGSPDPWNGASELSVTVVQITVTEVSVTKIPISYTKTVFDSRDEKEQTDAHIVKEEYDDQGNLIPDKSPSFTMSEKEIKKAIDGGDSPVIIYTEGADDTHPDEKKLDKIEYKYTTREEKTIGDVPGQDYLPYIKLEQNQILYAAYNPVEGVLNYKLTSDLAGNVKKVQIVEDDVEIWNNTDDTYIKGLDAGKQFKGDGTKAWLVKEGKKILLDETKKYWLQISTDSTTYSYKEPIIYGQYAEGDTVQVSPEIAKIIVYNPYDYTPVLTYDCSVHSDGKPQNVNGYYFYFFSDYFLSRPELFPKENVYNVILIDQQGKQKKPMLDVTLTEICWAGEYQMLFDESLPAEDRRYPDSDVKMDESNPYILYYGNADLSTAQIVIENVKVKTRPGDEKKTEPKFTFSPSNNAVRIENLQNEPYSDKDKERYRKYTATIRANISGKTKVTVQVGDITEEFWIEVKGKPPIERLSFRGAGEGSPALEERSQDIEIKGIGNRVNVYVIIDPVTAANSGEELQIIAGKRPDDAESDDTVQNWSDYVEIVENEITDWSDTVDVEVKGEKVRQKRIGKRITLKAKELTSQKAPDFRETITIGVKGRNEGDNKVELLTVNVAVGATTFTDAQKKLKADNVGVTYVVTNALNEGLLSEVALPAGWTWMEPETELYVDPSLQYFWATYSEKSYTDFNYLLPVAVTEIAGFDISGDSQLVSGKTGKYKITLKLKGWQQELNRNTAFANKLKSVTDCTWTSDDLIKLNETRGWEVTGTAKSVSGRSESVVRATLKAGSQEFKEEFPVSILTAQHINRIELTPQRPPTRYVDFVYDEDNNVVYLEESNVKRGADTIRIAAAIYMNDVRIPVGEGVLEWSVNDESLAKITDNGNGTVLLEILKSGTIIVTAKATDIGGRTAELPIEVRSYAPILEQKSYTLNKYSNTGVEVPVYAVEGNPISSINVGDGTQFRVVRSDDKWMLSLKDPDAFENKKTVKTTFHINTRMNLPAVVNVQITVETRKPKIAFKVKSAPNIFYTDAEAVYTVSCDQEIDNITALLEDRNKRTGFVFAEYDNATKQLTLKAKGLSASNVDLFKAKNSEFCQVNVQVLYKEYGTLTETIKITPKITKPSYKLQQIAALKQSVNPAAYTTDFTTYLYQSSNKEEVPLPQSATVTSLTDGVSAERSGSRIAVQYDGTKSKSYKIVVNDAVWTSSLTFTGKITKVTGFSTALGKNSITLNMGHDMSDDKGSTVNGKTAVGKIAIPVSLKNSDEIIRSAEITGANAKTKQLEKQGYVSIYFDRQDQCLYAGLDSNKLTSGVKAGAYSFNVTGTTEDGVVAKKATLKITLVSDSKPPKVTLSKKGSINLTDRDNTSVLLTPKLSNMTAAPDSVTVSREGSGSKYFTAKLLENGKIEVKARPNLSMSTKENYSLILNVTFDNGITVPAETKIKPVNKNPKIKASATNGTIYKVALNGVKWNVYNQSDYGAIESVTPVDSKAAKNFNVVIKDNALTVSLKDELKRTIKKGKYVISYQVKVKDAASNAKPVTLKMTVTVK